MMGAKVVRQTNEKIWHPKLPLSVLIKGMEADDLDVRREELARERIEEELRGPLETVSKNEKLYKRQNEVFAALPHQEHVKQLLGIAELEENTEGSRSVDERPGFLRRHKRKPEVDYMAKLVARDVETGEPVISDRDLVRFFRWYATGIAKLEEVERGRYEEDALRYVAGVRRAIERNPDLPREAVLEVVKRVDPDAPEYERPELVLADAFLMLEDPDNPETSVCQGGYFEEYPRAIGVFFSGEGDEQKRRHTSDHEHTHAMSGEVIDMHNPEAERILDEALTEYFGTLFGANEGEADEEDLEVEFGEGETYDLEREVLKFLGTGGKKEIPRGEWLAAYVERDERRDARRAEILKNSEGLSQEDLASLFYRVKYETPREYGPAQRRLIADLKEAFPECQSLSELGYMIQEKFEELKAEKPEMA